VTDKDATRTDDEIAFRAAINVLRDTLESRQMPSGLPLAPDAAELHERAAAVTHWWRRSGSIALMPQFTKGPSKNKCVM